MTEQEMLAKMVAPGTSRLGKWRDGVLQILVTSTCDKSCFNCTQASNVRREGKPGFMSPEQFEQAVRSLGFAHMPGTAYYDPSEHYFGVVGVFGGNPATSPHFREYCEVLRRLVPFEQRGLWCNNPMTLDLAQEMARTFNPGVSNLNVHLDRHAWELFKMGWPQAGPFGLDRDSRHSPPWVAMKDVVKKPCPDCPGYGPCPTCVGGYVPDVERVRELISGCDINQHWSAMIGVFRGELRAWFCEIAGAQAILHQHEPDYPDTGLDPTKIYTTHGPFLIGADAGGVETGMVRWWQLPMDVFRKQVTKHCFDCGVPLRGYGELAQADVVTGPRVSKCTCGADRTGPSAEAHDEDCPENPAEQVSATHAAVYVPKRKGRRVEVVTELVQLEVGKIEKLTHYMQNASK